MTRSARLAAASIALYLTLLLLADRFVDGRGQLALGAATWVVLVLACVPLSAIRRAQVAVVVVVATCGEIIGSIVWGVYTYRLENLPAFVPPGHGLVYLGGVALATAFGTRHKALVGVALVGVLTWGLAGVTVLPRADVAGFAGALLLAAFLVRSRAAPVYAGVFVVVAALELYGTAIGTWTWHETLPGTGIPNGNPPSGVASGYVFFDICALALAPRVVSLVTRGARSRGARGARLPVPARSA